MKMNKKRSYLGLNLGLGVSLFLIVCLLGGCASKGETVSDKLMFWKESDPIRIRPKRYDGATPQSTTSAETSASSAVESAESVEAALETSSSEPNAAVSEESQGDDPYEGLSASERKQMEKIEREAEAIRNSERVKSRLFKGL